MRPSRSSPEDPAPAVASLEELAATAESCTACPLFANATQTVFGEGAARARLVLVGEQPGDVEDKEGRPFVGPAGAVLDRALEAAAVPRTSIYLTNAVKHFKWEPRGKWRIHLKPRVTEIKACRPWLEAELAHVKPAAILCLGATAAQSVIGPGVTITAAKNRTFDTPFGPVMVTRHPSSVLRVREKEAREMAFEEIVEALRQAARFTATR